MRIPRFTLAFILAVGALGVACGSDKRDSDDGVGSADFSCTNAGGNLCDEYTGVPVDDLRADCKQQNGTAGRGCTRKGASGVCTETDGDVLIRKVYYGLSAEEAASAKELCEASDRVWSAT
jgi:hypothetical protein